MRTFRKELAAIIMLLSLTLFLASYSNFVAEGKAISQSEGLPSWATWAGAPWDVTNPGDTLVSAQLSDNKITIAAKGHWVWRTGYVWNPAKINAKGTKGDWQSFEFPQTSQYDGWASETAVAEMSLQSDEVLNGDNYVLAYTCNWKNGRWYCGCRSENECGKWQLQTFTARGMTDAIREDMSKYLTNPASVPDFQAIAQSVVVATDETATDAKADFDNDGMVDFDDFFLFAAAFRSQSYETKFDLSGNGKVDFDDFFRFADEFGKRIDISCRDFTSREECDANNILNVNVRCVWDSGEDDSSLDLVDSSRSPSCVAISKSCDHLAEADCDSSNNQGLFCVWKDGSCRKYSASLQSTGIRYKTTGSDISTDFGSSSDLYCPGRSRTMDWTTFNSDCPAGCVAEGGVSSPLYCVFSGRPYTVGEVQAMRAGASRSTYNPCLSMGYCDCIAGGQDQTNCGRIQRKSSEGRYYNTLGQINGCVWNGDPNSGTCMTPEQMSYFSNDAGASARAGQQCQSIGALKAERNECFICGPDSRWTKIQQSQDLLEPTLCDSVSSVGVQAAEVLIENAREESRLNAEALRRYQEEILPQMAQAVQDDKIRDLNTRLAADNNIIKANGLVNAIQKGLLDNFDDFYYTRDGPVSRQPLGCVEGSVCGNGGMCFDGSGQCMTCSGEERVYDRNADYDRDIKFYEKTDNTLCNQIQNNENPGMNVDSANYHSETNKGGGTTIRSDYSLSFRTPESYRSDWIIDNYKISVQTTKITGSYSIDSTNRKTQFSIRKFTDAVYDNANGNGKRYEVYDYKDTDMDGAIEPNEFIFSAQIIYENQGRKSKRAYNNYKVSQAEIDQIKAEIQKQLNAAAART